MFQAVSHRRTGVTTPERNYNQKKGFGLRNQAFLPLQNVKMAISSDRHGGTGEYPKTSTGFRAPVGALSWALLPVAIDVIAGRCRSALDSIQ